MKTVKHSRLDAFTLLEIMLVVAIIALLLSTGFYFLGPQIGVGRDTKLIADFKVFDTALQGYANFGGGLPSNEQGLQALVAMPEGDPKPVRWYQQLTQLPKDPWGSDYVYVCPTTHNNPLGYDIYSKGPDRLANTADDKNNWDPAYK